MSTPAKQLLVSFLCLSILTLTAALMWTARPALGDPPNSPASEVGPPDIISGCVGLLIPDGDTEVGTGINRQTHIATFEWVDILGDHRINVNYLDPACQANPSVQSYVADALADDAIHQAEFCAYLTDVANGTEAPQRSVTQAGALEYVQHRC